ncbi:hypothetical protein DY000_02012671 [Brassica cretica]|uniref:Uncharacterized protein n=1 Tax=Brassica cretica TaxID=69181 RepID=A0ABQ7CYR4_BRACR|nr:hypothetical protein DY000_02012671 [Brassica cretica]
MQLEKERFSIRVQKTRLLKHVLGIHVSFSLSRNQLRLSLSRDLSLALRRVIPHPLHEFLQSLLLPLSSSTHLASPILLWLLLKAVIALNNKKNKSNFKEEIEKTHASNPLVWRYDSTENIGDAALKEFQVDIQTFQGLTTKNILVAGSN